MNLRVRTTRLDQARALAWLAPVSIRLAAPADTKMIERIAQLDSRPLPPAPHLVAERDGAIEAVLSLRSGEVVADPFHRTAELVELLRCHAGGIRLDRLDPPDAPAPDRTETRLRPRLANAGGCA